VGAAIVIGVAAVMLLSLAKAKLTFGNLRAALFTRQTAIGLASGAFLGFCTVAYRAASDSLDSDDLVTRASFTAAVSVIIQSVLMGVWMLRRAPDELKKTFIYWRDSSIVGLSGRDFHGLLVHRIFAVCGGAGACRGTDRIIVCFGHFLFLFPRKANTDRIDGDYFVGSVDCDGFVSLTSPVAATNVHKCAK
jgi:hypothetical protein